ncbi:WD40 repeat-like protein [Dacryopinax primogenitus]|uniref:WD40 repeat-like protein n=1 Tax=Dacryopinax primogenitus (strain DJM 731) TaxID=1858805 RepID=M5FXM7_DACPD|nr:WD40 repeat-like protein [Dacryopinax primogenitus]EJU01234.1 WD40 repeat-like protein [Dacryopinax primogenitus]
MRVRTLEIRWHNTDSSPSAPIYSADFQPLPQPQLRKLVAARTHASSSSSASQSNVVSAFDVKTAAQSCVGAQYRLATGGGDNNVRVWLVYPNYLPTVLGGGTSGATPHPPRVEYLATLSRHTGAVNVVRFSPNGELIASAGDDGCILIWAPTERAVPQFGSDVTQEQQYEKEHWRNSASQREIYDLVWSPSGEYILAGSTDNVARIFNVSSGSCIKELVEHSHYVQGVAWDPLNEYIATQSSDRTVHVHSVSVRRENDGRETIETQAVGRNFKAPVRHHHRALSSASQRSQSPRPPLHRQGSESALSINSAVEPTQTPASVPSTPSLMYPPLDRPSSRRSSFTSMSNASPPPSSALLSHNRRTSGTSRARSPSPMPPLPAIRAAPSPASWTSLKLYGDEQFTNFFRRLTFSPDGALLLTPAGQFEDPTFSLASRPPSSASSDGRSRSEERKTASSVYIYSRANFARPPVAHLPGYKTASVVVKFSPLLYELRSGIREAADTPMVILKKGEEQTLPISLGAPTSADEDASTNMPSPTKVSPTTGEDRASVWKLPYRMIFAVATQDTVVLYDTQQAGPLAMFANLHYASFTDIAWAPDGQSLIMSSSDGYCSIAVFDDPLPLYERQQHHVQMAAIAEHHSVPMLNPTLGTHSKVALPWPGPPTESSSLGKRESSSNGEEQRGRENSGPVKKKRRVELKHIGSLDSA